MPIKQHIATVKMLTKKRNPPFNGARVFTLLPLREENFHLQNPHILCHPIIIKTLFPCSFSAYLLYSITASLARGQANALPFLRKCDFESGPAKLMAPFEAGCATGVNKIREIRPCVRARTNYLLPLKLTLKLPLTSPTPLVMRKHVGPRFA